MGQRTPCAVPPARPAPVAAGLLAAAQRQPLLACGVACRIAGSRSCTLLAAVDVRAARRAGNRQHGDATQRDRNRGVGRGRVQPRGCDRAGLRRHAGGCRRGGRRVRLPPQEACSCGCRRCGKRRRKQVAAAAEQRLASPPPPAPGEQVGRRTGCAVPLPDAPCRFEMNCAQNYSEPL